MNDFFPGLLVAISDLNHLALWNLIAREKRWRLFIVFSLKVTSSEDSQLVADGVAVVHMLSLSVPNLTFALTVLTCGSATDRLAIELINLYRHIEELVIELLILFILKNSLK